MLRALLLASALVFTATGADAKGKSSSSGSKAKVCSKGKACGNSCIAKSATCHQEKGTATNADGSEQPSGGQKSSPEGQTKK